MRISRNTLSAFTLIELIVAITIFGIIMISVMSIFTLSSQMSGKIELTRAMQENMKNALEDIAESVRKGDVKDVVNVGADCDDFSTGKGDKLCLNIDSGEVEYAVGNKNSPGGWSPLVDASVCSDNYTETPDSVCRILKKISPTEWIPLTNNLIAFEKLEFSVHNEDIPRVTVRITARPAYRNGVGASLVKASRMHIQTTLSERAIITQ